MAGLVAVSLVVVFLLGGSGQQGTGTATAIDWLKIAIGALFLFMAARQWRKRPKEGEDPAVPSWMATIDTVRPAKALLLGAALSGANPKNFALTAAAAASIAQAGLDGADTAIAIAAFVVIGSLTVVGSILYYLIDADRAAGPLAGMKEFMLRHNAVIMMVLLLVLGAKILGDGAAGLWG